MGGIEPYMLISGEQWNRTIAAVIRNILAGCRNKPSFAYSPIVGDTGFEPVVSLMYRIYSPALLRHRSRTPGKQKTRTFCPGL